VCSSCGEPRRPEPWERELLAQNGLDPDAARLRRGAGCAACGGIGYLGRVAIYELLVATPELRRAIARGAPEDDVRAIAAASGVRPILRRGLELAAEGRTTVEEVLLRAKLD